MAGLLAQSFEANISHEQRSGKESTQGGGGAATADAKTTQWNVPQGMPVQPTPGYWIAPPVARGVKAVLADRRFIACSCYDAHRF